MQNNLPAFTYHELDIRNPEAILQTIASIQPNAIIHTAAQPSYDLATVIPFDDFSTNVVGTLNLLEAMRRHSIEVPFVHMSTNKVYGDAPDEIEIV